MMTFRDLQKMVHETAVQHRFEAEADIHRSLLLIVGEIAEAQNELRDGHSPTELYFSAGNKPEGFPVELADAHIRLMNLETAVGIYNMEDFILAKDAYNRTRPHKHGKAF